MHGVVSNLCERQMVMFGGPCIQFGDELGTAKGKGPHAGSMYLDLAIIEAGISRGIYWCNANYLLLWFFALCLLSVNFRSNLVS